MKLSKTFFLSLGFTLISSIAHSAEYKVRLLAWDWEAEAGFGEKEGAGVAWLEENKKEGDAQFSGASLPLPLTGHLVGLLNFANKRRKSFARKKEDKNSATDNAANLEGTCTKAGNRFKTWTGVASYYPNYKQERLTASGAKFNNGAFTAAHLSLPFGTHLIVKNLSNGACVEVVVNDRGPYVKNRMIDLTQAAAERLGFMKEGLTKVEVSLAMQ